MDLLQFDQEENKSFNKYMDMLCESQGNVGVQTIFTPTRRTPTVALTSAVVFNEIPQEPNSEYEAFVDSLCSAVEDLPTNNQRKNKLLEVRKVVAQHLHTAGSIKSKL